MKSYIRGNSYDRRRRRAFLWARDSVGGLTWCKFCGTGLTRERVNIVRWPRAKARFTRDNIVCACMSCARSGPSRLTV